MSKRMSVLILSLVTLLVAFQAAEFFTAPQSPADYIKSQIAMKRVENRVQQTFDQSGVDGVAMLTNYPINEMGYTFTVSLHFTNTNDYHATGAFVFLYSNPNDAEMATGRTFYDQEILADWNTPYEPPHLTLVSASTPLRTSNINLQTVPRLDLGS